MIRSYYCSSALSSCYCCFNVTATHQIFLFAKVVGGINDFTTLRHLQSLFFNSVLSTVFRVCFACGWEVRFKRLHCRCTHRWCLFRFRKNSGGKEERIRIQMNTKGQFKGLILATESRQFRPNQSSLTVVSLSRLPKKGLMISWEGKRGQENLICTCLSCVPTYVPVAQDDTNLQRS